MKLALLCLLHPREHVDRMEEIGRVVRQLGWNELVTYGIVVGRIGYYVECEWSAEKQTSASARGELVSHGIAATECEVCLWDDYPAAQARRRAAGYYDEMTAHA